MEMKSQRIGDWRRPFVIINNSLSGRPRSIKTMVAPTIRAKTVIASAILVIGRRHSAPDTRRMAEMSVPACEMPIKNTKFVI